MKPVFLFGILGYCYGSITLSHLWPVGVPSSRLLNLFDMTLVVSVVSYFGVKQDVLGYFFAPDLEPLLFFPLCFSCLHLEQDALFTSQETPPFYRREGTSLAVSPQRK